MAKVGGAFDDWRATPVREGTTSVSVALCLPSGAHSAEGVVVSNEAARPHEGTRALSGQDCVAH